MRDGPPPGLAPRVHPRSDESRSRVDRALRVRRLRGSHSRGTRRSARHLSSSPHPPRIVTATVVRTPISRRRRMGYADPESNGGGLEPEIVTGPSGLAPLYRRPQAEPSRSPMTTVIGSPASLILNHGTSLPVR